MSGLQAEVADHRYDPCHAGTDCYQHVQELAGSYKSADDSIDQLCEPDRPWREGIEGLVDPRELPLGTLQRYEGDEHRDRLRLQVIEAMLSAAEAGSERPDAILTMGGPGSGKSTTLDYLGLCQADVVLVDPDLVKRSLVEYQAGMAARDKLAADRVHRESSMVAKQLRDRAMAESRELCIDGVLSKKDSALELIGRLQDAGYEVTLVAAVVPFELAWERIVVRGEQTGRFVPYEFAAGAHARIAEHADEVLAAADAGYLFDTSGPMGSEPVLLREYRQGKLVFEASDP